MSHPESNLLIFKQMILLLSLHTHTWKKMADFNPKTTRCLMKNITSFCEKQHVVLWETTRRFCTKIFGKNTPKRDKSTHFFRISITDQQTKFLIPLHFIDILHLTEKLWHLWQQKNNIAVGRRALRVHAREFSLSAHLALPLRLGNNLVILSFLRTFDRREWQNRDYRKNVVTFPRFFHSFHHFEPIYYRG